MNLYQLLHLLWPLDPPTSVWILTNTLKFCAFVMHYHVELNRKFLIHVRADIFFLIFSSIEKNSSISSKNLHLSLILYLLAATTPKDCSPTLSPLNAFSRSMDNSSLSRSVEQLSSPLESEPRRNKQNTPVAAPAAHSRSSATRGGTWGSISRWGHRIYYYPSIRLTFCQSSCISSLNLHKLTRRKWRFYLFNIVLLNIMKGTNFLFTFEIILQKILSN